MSKEELRKKIQEQEEKTRKYCNYLFPTLFKKNFVRGYNTTLTTNVDYQFTAQTSTYDVEVKMLNHNFNYMSMIGGCGIKCDKHVRIKNFNEVSGNEKLIYMVVLYDAIIIYDFAAVDLNKVKYFMWKEKEKELDDDSKIVEVPAFNIPLSMSKQIYYMDNTQWYETFNGKK